MVATHSLVIALGAFLSLPLTTFAGLVQRDNLVLPDDAAARQEDVKTMFLDSYGAYKEYAFGHDDVSPISETSSDGRNGWGATIVDAMDTMIIMGLEDLFEEAVEFSSNIDFSQSKTADSVSVFESTIRYIGGLLSAYELSNCQYSALLNKAKQLADKLSGAWVGTNDIPYGYLNFTTGSPTVATSNIAEAGTLTLEWATLSKYTGNDNYRKLAEKSALHIAQMGAPLPGLPAQGIDPTTGSAVGGYVTWSGGSDSYFEYLIKYARLNQTVNPVFADTWRTAVDSSIRTLRKTSLVGGHVYLADYDDTRQIRHVGSHLECFHGGNWLFGGRLLNNQTIVDVGLSLVDACWNTYASTATGIGPEVFAYVSSDGGYTGATLPPSADQLAFNAEHGFYITTADYILRPEVLESNFYAWRVTGDTKYLDRAAQAMDSFKKYLQVPGSKGYAGVNDVNNGTVGADWIDDTESFWYAEVLKYLYLTFDDPSHISLDEFVFNTEAHPFKVPAVGADYTYGTGNTVQAKEPFKTTNGPLPAVSAIPAVPNLVFGLADIVGTVLGAIKL